MKQNKLVVTKSNALLDASYKLNPNAQKLILACISNLDPRKPAPKEARMTAKEYSERMGIDYKNAHRELYKAVDELYRSTILIREHDDETEVRWIQEKAKKIRGEGEVRLIWSDRILKHISEIQNRFSSYDLKAISSLQAGHSIRLYELLMRFNDQGWRKISVVDFKSALGISDKYPTYKELNRRIIQPSIKELNQRSDLDIYLSTVKNGRSVKYLHFDFKLKDQMVMDI